MLHFPLFLFKAVPSLPSPSLSSLLIFPAFTFHSILPSFSLHFISSPNPYPFPLFISSSFFSIFINILFLPLFSLPFYLFFSPFCIPSLFFPPPLSLTSSSFPSPVSPWHFLPILRALYATTTPCG